MVSRGMAIIEKNLAKRIEQVIVEFLAESRAAAAAAVEQTFLIAPRPSKGPVRKASRPAASRRTATEINAIRERFLLAVQRMPGENMETLSVELGEASNVLQRYAMALRDQGLIRTVGKLHATRYFPLARSALVND